LGGKIKDGVNLLIMEARSVTLLEPSKKVVLEKKASGDGDNLKAAITAI
jgi:hypothetical protein